MNASIAVLHKSVYLEHIATYESIGHEIKNICSTIFAQLSIFYAIRSTAHLPHNLTKLAVLDRKVWVRIVYIFISN